MADQGEQAAFDFLMEQVKPAKAAQAASGAPDDEELPDDDLGEEPEQDANEQTEQTAQEEGEADDLDEGEEFGSYSDDDLLEVTIDGEKREVSIRDLKSRFSGEGAIEKRLQEATELRKAAAAEREAAQQEVEQHRANMLQTIQQLDQFLFMPLVQKPDPALRTTRMNEYLMQKDAYEEDQGRISQLRAAAAQVIQQHQQQQVQARSLSREQESRMLLQKEPSLAKPEGVAAFQDDLQRAVAHYGFTPAQLAEVDNHALFLMARDAGRYLKLANKTANGVPSNGDGAETEGQKKVKRLLRPGTVASNPVREQSVKARKAAEARARETGSVDDVTAMLLANMKTAKTPSRRNH